MATYEVTTEKGTYQVGTQDNQQLEQSPQNYGGFSPRLSAPLLGDQYQPGILSPAQRALYSTASNPQGQYNALKYMGFHPGDINLNPDGKMQVGDKLVEPNYGSWVDFFKHDFLGGLASGAIKMLPIAGQIAGEAGALALAPETGGASLGGQMAAQGIGSAAGDYVRQQLGNLIYGQNLNKGSLAANAVFGAITPPVGKALEVPLKGMAKMFNFIGDKLGDVTPAVMEGISGKPAAMFEHGEERGWQSVLTPKNLDPTVPEQIFRKNFFGADNAPITIDNLHKTFLEQQTNAVSDLAKIDNMEMWQKTFSMIQPQDWQTMLITKPGELSTDMLTNTNALMQTSRGIYNNLNIVQKNLGKKVGDAKDAILNNPEKASKTIDLNPALSDMIKGYSQDIQLLSEKGQLLPKGQGYESTAAKGMLQTVLEHLKESGSLLPRTPTVGSIDEGLQELVEGQLKASKFGATAEQQAKNISAIMGQAGEETPVTAGMAPKFFKDIPASKAMAILKNLDPTLDKVYQGESVPAPAKRYLAQFLDNIRGQVAKVSDDYAMANKNFSDFRTVIEGAFGEKGLENNIYRGTSQVSKFLTNAYNKPELQQLASQIDRFISERENKILPTIFNINAAQNLSVLKNPLTMQTPVRSWIGNIKQLFNPGDFSQPIKETMQRWNSALPVNSQFLDRAKDHLLATELSSNKINFLRSRAMFYILGGGALAHINPVLGGMGMLGGLLGLSPKGMGKILTYKDIAMQGAKNIGARTGQFAQNSISPSAKTALLSALIRKTQGQ